MKGHYLKLMDGRTELRKTMDESLVALWNRKLEDDEVEQIMNDEYMTFMLKLPGGT